MSSLYLATSSCQVTVTGPERVRPLPVAKPVRTTSTTKRRSSTPAAPLPQRNWVINNQTLTLLSDLTGAA